MSGPGYGISHSALSEKISKAVIEALRSGVHIDIIDNVLEQARKEIASAKPLLAAANESRKAP